MHLVGWLVGWLVSRFHCLLPEYCSPYFLLPQNSSKATKGQASASSGNKFQSSDKDKQGDIHIVTAEDVAANRFTIRDVIIPIAGHSIILPENNIGELLLR